MPTKTILSPAQRTAIFDPPTDCETIERLHTLGTDDLIHVARRRRGANRLGYAVQLCYLRHPGRGLLTGEAPPAILLSLLCDQIGCHADDFSTYAARPTTLREHRAEIETYLGLRTFGRSDIRPMLTFGREIATSTDRGETVVAGMIDRLRLDRVVLPAASTLERLALIVRTRARQAAIAGLIRDCAPEQEAALDGLISSGEHGRNLRVIDRCGEGALIDGEDCTRRYSVSRGFPRRSAPSCEPVAADADAFRGTEQPATILAIFASGGDVGVEVPLAVSPIRKAGVVPLIMLLEDRPAVRHIAERIETYSRAEMAALQLHSIHHAAELEATPAGLAPQVIGGRLGEGRTKDYITDITRRQILIGAENVTLAVGDRDAFGQPWQRHLTSSPSAFARPSTRQGAGPGNAPDPERDDPFRRSGVTLQSHCKRRNRRRERRLLSS